jgi:hypothetical protein
MRCNGNDGHDGNTFLPGALVRPVVKKDPEGAGSLVLRVGLPYSFAFHALQRLVFVCVQTRMPNVDFEQAERLQDLLVQAPFRRVGRQRLKLPGRLVCETQLPLHVSTLCVSSKRAEILGAARSGILKATLH